MKKIDLGQMFSILANVGVIAGIVFLGIELQQNNELLFDEAQRARAQAFRENQGMFAEYAEIRVKDANGETLTAAEAYRMHQIWLMNLWSFQTGFQQLPRNEVEGGGNLFRRQYHTMPSLSTTWEQNRDIFDPDFVRFMEESVFLLVDE